MGVDFFVSPQPDVAEGEKVKGGNNRARAGFVVKSPQGKGRKKIGHFVPLFTKRKRSHLRINTDGSVYRKKVGNCAADRQHWVLPKEQPIYLPRLLSVIYQKGKKRKEAPPLPLYTGKAEKKRKPNAPLLPLTPTERKEKMSCSP